MSNLVWSDAFKLNVDVMDEDHAKLVELLNGAEQAPSSALEEFLDALLQQLGAHFAHEEELMDRVGFFAADCHKKEHARVLAEAGEVRARLQAGDEDAARLYLSERMPCWFIQHLRTMDAATAAFALRSATP